MLKQKPYVGQTVLFMSNQDDTVAKSNHNKDYIPAIITRIFSDMVVNIKIIPDCGPMQDRTSVTHISLNSMGYHFKFLNPVRQVIEVQETRDLLVQFGNFLFKRYEVPESDTFTTKIREVSHADVENWKVEAGVVPEEKNIIMQFNPDLRLKTTPNLEELRRFIFANGGQVSSKQPQFSLNNWGGNSDKLHLALISNENESKRIYLVLEDGKIRMDETCDPNPIDMDNKKEM